ncbi:TetR family transcriptional regulator [Mycobacterium sp. M1]|uniref:TetR family transcriptional regulator n=2 Tax=Mycolicibacter acidiphilus TaxID=2835306 RepID=A0ABS5RMS7_9MYCO|nr:TetR family transcriptional regulator [Mycolicibacter acidiphilus]
MFSAQGYNATSMEAIAAKVDISAPALYRHYASKYDMFAAVVSALGQELVRHTDFVDEVSDAEVAADPEALLNRLVHALIDAALLTRASGGLYRWERRYLRPEDQAELMKGMRLVNKRIQRGLLKTRPGLSAQERWMLSVGLLSVIGSVNEHRISADDDVVREVLSEAATALLSVEFPEAAACEPARLSVWRIFTPDAGPYESLLYKAIMLFGEQGYAETSVTQIADAIGVPASGVYRYFSSKGEILGEAFKRSADRVAGELSAIVGVFPDPRQALDRLIEAYVATWLANPELSAIYETERVNLTSEEQELLRDTERGVTDSWVGPLSALRPDLGVVPARLLVHAAVSLVADPGHLLRDQKAEPGYAQACMRRMMTYVLLGGAG